MIASRIEIVRAGKRRLPKWEPIVPPMIAGIASAIPSVGIEWTATKYPNNPPIEFTKMNKAETAAA